MNKPENLILDYAQNVWEISNAYANDSENVFVIGHGIGTLTSQFEREKKQVKVAEIDKDVLEVSREYFEYEGNSVLIGDGRNILREQTEQFDVMVLDAYNDTKQIPFHLVSKEFFSLTFKKLQQNGILIINTIGTPSHDITIESINTTLRSIYPYVYVFAQKDDDELQNLIMVASKMRLNPKDVKGQHIVNVKKGKIILDEDTKLKNLK